MGKEEELVEVEENSKKAMKKSRKTKWEKKCVELEQELEEQKDKYLRLYAEFDNFKKRSVKEKMDFLKNASMDTLKSILPVLDDFDRAKQSVDSEDNDETWPDGVVLVYSKLYSVLESKGLKAMETDGQVFDAELHDAVTNAPAPSEDMKGKVIHTVEKGYYLNEKIIRHAKVVVGS